MSTNANSRLIADLLADSRNGTFTGLITTKKGKTRGRGADKKVYGNDTVHVVVYTGFRYENLVRRSLEMLDDITDAEIVSEACRRGIFGWAGKPKVEVPITATDVALARQELRESFERTLDPTQESTSTTAHVYEPLVVDGETVRAGRVYKCVEDDPSATCKCRNCTEDDSAPLPGTIYLQGLAIGQKVIEPAPNGPVPAAKSAPKTVAKNLLRSKLPVRRYVSYALEPGTDFILRAGGAAAAEVTTAGISIDTSVLKVVKAA